MNEMSETDLFGKCPYATAQKVFSGKWSILLIQFLSERTYRYGELQRKLPEVTQTTLTKQLRKLEEFGLIHREVYQEVPPKVEYSLTELGRDFSPVLEEFKLWGEKYIRSISDREAKGETN
ncbi:MAG: winged helix-turn-helix transcriptional regulator [Anaerofustis sp.]